MLMPKLIKENGLNFSIYAFVIIIENMIQWLMSQFVYNGWWLDNSREPMYGLDLKMIKLDFLWEIYFWRKDWFYEICLSFIFIMLYKIYIFEGKD